MPVLKSSALRFLALALGCGTMSAVIGTVPEPATKRESTGELVRGPYLQTGAPTSLVVRWRTANAADGWVQCGIDPDFLNLNFGGAALTADHQVLLSGLQPNTKYYYRVASRGQILVGGPDCFFVTPPTTGKPTRIWVTSDMQSHHPETLDAYRQFARERSPDLWLALGDNGGDDEASFQVNLFDTYAGMLRQSVLWPCQGNHDSGLGSVYWDLFSLPANGEAGGIPSGTEHYYSFDYGNIHFVVLDSFTEDRSSNGAMHGWLERDLNANDRDWLIAFWHIPPYTKGHYDSDLEPEGIEMRENFLPLLEARGVDLVLSGDNHTYERSYLLDSHYGDSTSLETARMIKNGGDGRWQGSGPYGKPSTGPAPHQGTVYAKVTSAYAYEPPATPHPVMFHTEAAVGSLVLDIDGHTLDAAFLRDNGQIDDRFTILKGVSAVPPRIAHCQVSAGQFQLTWHAVPGKSYRVERSDDWGGAWLPVSPWLRAGQILMAWAEPATPVAATRFYRLTVSPE